MKTNPHNHELFNDKSEIYEDSRPRYPAALYEFLTSLCAHKGNVWDAACGSGQASIDLTHYFKNVQASDISPEQISHAPHHPRITYSVQPAEVTNFADRYFDLVCVAQALHWFDTNRFWPEVQRILKPGGIFAAWGYSWFSINGDIDKIIAKEFLQKIQPFWAPQNKLLWDNYVDVPIPFPQIDGPDIELKMNWDTQELFAYLHSWSATRRCMANEGDAFFRQAYEKVARVWGNSVQKRPLKMDLCLIVGRK